MVGPESLWPILEVKLALDEEGVKLLWIGTIEGIRFVDLGTRQRGVGGSHRAREPIYGDGEVVEDDHPSVILTGKTTNGFSFFIIIVWFEIVAAGVITIRIITIGIIISGAIATGDVVLLVVFDSFNECTGGTTSRGSAFPSREVSELRDRGGGAPSASKGAKSSGTTSVSGCDGFGGVCVSSAQACLNSSGHWYISELVQRESLNILSRLVLHRSYRSGGQGVRAWSSGKTKRLRSVVALPKG